jgi:hypothetical protein
VIVSVNLLSYTRDTRARHVYDCVLIYICMPVSVGDQRRGGGEEGAVRRERRSRGVRRCRAARVSRVATRTSSSSPKTAAASSPLEMASVPPSSGRVCLCPARARSVSTTQTHQRLWLWTATCIDRAMYVGPLPSLSLSGWGGAGVALCRQSPSSLSLSVRIGPAARA